MGLETGDYITDFNPDWPLGAEDPKSEGDDHLRLLKRAIKQSFPLVDAPVQVFAAAFNAMVGTIQSFPYDAGAGWIYCDGQAISRAAYPVLFGNIGVIYGAGDGETTFNVPDYRGSFLRGQDDGAGVDGDAASRNDRGDGTIGDAIGTKQDWAMPNITGGTTPPGNERGIFNSAHGAFALTSVNTGWAGTGNTGNQESGFSFDASRVAQVGADTRPTNLYVKYYILAG